MYLRLAKCCPEVSKRTARLSRQVNHSSPKKVVVYATADINAISENPIELWTNYFAKVILDQKIRKARPLSTQENVKNKRQKLAKLAKTPAAPPGKVGKEEAATEEKVDVDLTDKQVRAKQVRAKAKRAEAAAKTTAAKETIVFRHSMFLLQQFDNKQKYNCLIL